MTESAVQLGFTSRLSELMAHGVPVRKAVRDIGSACMAGQKMQSLCAEIGRGLEEGRTLSSVLASCATVSFPRWYTAFVGAAEQSGCVGETFSFLSETIIDGEPATDQAVGDV